jgi:hypothetical protein
VNDFEEPKGIEEELRGNLRRAVDKIRSEPVPPEALKQALQRVRSLNMLNGFRQRRRSILAVAGIAASLLLGLSVWQGWTTGETGIDKGQVAQNTRLGLHPDLDGDARVFDNRETRSRENTEEERMSRFKSQEEENKLKKNLGDVKDLPGLPDPNSNTDSFGSSSAASGSGKGPAVRSLETLPAKPMGAGPGMQGGAGIQGINGGLGGFNGGMGGFGGGLGGIGGPLPNNAVAPNGIAPAPGVPSIYTATMPTPGGLPKSGAGGPGQGDPRGYFIPADGKGASTDLSRSQLGAGYLAPQSSPASRSGGDNGKPNGGTDKTKEEKKTFERSLDLAKKKDAKDREKAVDDDDRLKSLKESEEKADKGKEGGAKAEVYLRDRGRPTFARVYVGDQNSLELVSLQVTVTVEGPRARTVVDHIFRNPHDRQLEGTFEYPLPAGASPSYFAMFLGQTRDTVPQRFDVKGNPQPLPAEALGRMAPAELVKHIDTDSWGRLQEARIVSKEKALETYEDVVRGRIDPALLEYSGGNTFTGRVFPIPPRGYNRILIVYEELLPVIQDQVVYRFPRPDCPLSELQFTLSASTADYKEATLAPKGAIQQAGAGRLTFTQSWKDQGPGGEEVFAFTPASPAVQAISGRQGENGPVYLFTRIRPELKVEKAAPFAQHAVFLLDTSLSEHPGRFAVNVMLLKKILESDPDIQHFNILTFNVGSALVEPKGWIENTAEGREKALAKLNGLVLEGATDLSAALNRLAQSLQGSGLKAPVNLFLLSDGQITWGDSEVGPLVSRFEQQCPCPFRFHCYRTGLSAENVELYEALTRRGGGVFNCFTEEDLKAAALAHRNQCLQIDSIRLSGGPAASDVLVAGRQAAVFPGGELIVAGKVGKAGRTSVVVEGTFLGQKWAQKYPVEITGYSELAPRAWGELAVASLLALNDPKLDGLATAYCQQFGIGSRLASFLVLENDADYKRFNLEEERGKTLSGDLGKFLDDTWHTLGQVLPARAAWTQFLGKIEPRVHLLNGANSEGVKKLLALLTDGDYELPESRIEGKLLHIADVPPEYLARREANLREATVYLAEARRRSEVGDAGGAVSVLSSIIEQYPTRSDALRLVGYRLLDLQQSVEAACLFEQVVHQRPFEPHSYRDLARGLEECGKYGLAALQYEIILAGTWHNRFHESLKVVAREEYAHMMREAIARKAVGPELANLFGDRLEQMDPRQLQSDLRVTISWNTDATDVDLWVIEPDNTKCYYQNRTTPSGGQLTEDMTQGYGPERYEIKKARKGVYRVIVHYFRPNPNLLAGETHVNVVVTRNAGTPQEVIERRTVILKRQNEEVRVCEIEF